LARILAIVEFGFSTSGDPIMIDTSKRESSISFMDHAGIDVAVVCE